ncbi:hypothetical protein HPP92_029020 [Vanilla planifolia]|uniref:Uncharacterized protein n=1 Tax=Vanilla planifolia TaxID=51239 RepID=A0A835U4R4_VANPL|nr:hypothetical protein HPP92_029008 [Vanilla planifolia]KAG0446088.1 hypothetical protein HPP92_029020 [Vanilla planifolia]
MSNQSLNSTANSKCVQSGVEILVLLAVMWRNEICQNYKRWFEPALDGCLVRLCLQLVRVRQTNDE